MGREGFDGCDWGCSRWEREVGFRIGCAACSGFERMRVSVCQLLAGIGLIDNIRSRYLTHRGKAVTLTPYSISWSPWLPDYTH